jgi:hypothetical protein
MIKHYENKEKGLIYAVAKGCEFDAIRKIVKRYPYIEDVDSIWRFTQDQTTGNVKSKLGYGLEKALMPNTFVAVVKCHESDTYDYNVGRAEADKKLLAKIDASEKKAIARWKKHQIAILDAVDLSNHK